MLRLQVKYKVSISLEELQELRNNVEAFLIDYNKLCFDKDKEFEIYRLADIHTLLYSWIEPKIISLRKSGRVTTECDIPLTHAITLWRILQRVPISRLMQRNVLAQLDQIYTHALPVHNDKNNT